MENLQQQIQQILANQASPASPLLMPRMQILQVSGEAGARNIPMGPDSTCFAIDTTYTEGLLVWFVQTDSAGNKVTVADYDLAPHVHKAPPDFDGMETMMKKLCDNMEQLNSRVSTIEEALK